MDFRVGLIILLLFGILIVLWRIIVTLSARRISTSRVIEKTTIRCRIARARKNLVWINWDKSFDELSELLGLLVSYGNIFSQVISRKKFYFREILRSVESINALRSWLINAQAYGLVKKKLDSSGVYYYELDSEGLKKAIKFIEDAIDDLR